MREMAAGTRVVAVRTEMTAALWKQRQQDFLWNVGGLREGSPARLHGFCIEQPSGWW